MSGRLHLKLSGRIARDEEAVRIKRELVAEALRPADEPVDLAGLLAQLEHFSYSAFRVEACQVYQGTGRDDEWVAMLKAGRRWGKRYQRIHIVAEPLTPAMQRELTEGYAPNVSAGEDIGIIPVAGLDEWPTDVPRSDWWLFDSSVLLEMDYEPDGAWAGARRVRDPERIVAAGRARDAALHRAVSWRTYIASRPELQQRVAR